MEKYSEYHIETDGFEKVLIGIFHMVQTVPIGKKCRVILNYDPTLPKAKIETFIDKSDAEQVQEKPFQWCPYDSTQEPANIKEETAASAVKVQKQQDCEKCNYISQEQFCRFIQKYQERSNRLKF